jgi:hypothetical protein
MTITIVTISKIQNRSQTYKPQSLNSANSALPLLAVLVEKPDPRGEKRARERDQGKALAGKSTLNRLELTGAEVSEEAGSAELCAAAHYSAGLSGDDRQPSGYMTITIVTISKIQNRSQTHKPQSLNGANSALAPPRSPAGGTGGEARPARRKRRRERDQSKALAGKSTLNRLELSAPEAGSADLLWRSAAFS